MDTNKLPQFQTPDQEQVEQPTSTVFPKFDIEDADLISVIEKKIDEAKAFTKNILKLDRRVKDNEDFWIGRHFDESNYETWQIPYRDNIIWQDTETRISLAASRMPDIITTPADIKDVKKKEAAKTLGRALDIRIRTDVTKRLVKNGLRNNHLNFIGCLKVRWNKDKDDFEFIQVRPDRIVVDTSATIPEDGFTADNMDIIAEWVEEPLSVIISKFPSKKDDIFTHMGIIRGTPRQMMKKYKYLEVWLTWYDQSGKRMEGTVWKYNKLILGKSKNPYWDWTGYERTTKEINEETGNNEVETIYRNHFEMPRKPYIFFSYQNTGKSPYDDTSAVEQAIPLQKIVNKRGRQITEIADRAVPKLAFAGAYITKEEARRVTNDPDEHIWFDKSTNDIRMAMAHIPASPPAPILYQDLVSNRNQIDSKFSTHGTTRGEVSPQESGISKQITREGDFATSDDIVSITVERVVYEMANWAVQMMKLNYEKSHFVRNVGPDGELVEIELKRDMIDDGVAVNVKASSVDKAERRAIALQMAARRATDPFTLNEDLDLPNPKERAKRNILFTGGDLAGYLKEIGVEMTPPTAGGGNETEQARSDVQRLMAGEEVEPPDQLTGEYVNAVRSFINSPDFQAQDPNLQDKVRQFVDKMRQKTPA